MRPASTGWGVGKGDRGWLFYLANSVQLVVAFLAIQKIGAAAVMVSPIYTSFEIEYMIRDSKARTIICHDTNISYVRDIFEASGLKNIIYTRLLDLMPWYKRTLGFAVRQGAGWAKWRKGRTFILSGN